MSLFTSDRQKPKVESFNEIFTTAVVNFFPTSQRGKVCIQAIIDNQDGTNSITFTKNGRGGTVFTVPPNSIVIIENEVLDALVITPNAVTGTGQISASLVTREDLEKGGYLE